MLLHTFDDHHQQQQPRDSFRSYVAAYDNEKPVKNGGEAPSFGLLNGEIVSSQCDDVLLYPPFQENYFGKLYCTNFRICFVPLTQQQRDPCCSRSLIFADDHQVPLCSVAAIHYTSFPVVSRAGASSKKFRLMTAPASQLDIISCIKIYTKDFRVWTFDLQRSQFAVNLANNIYHFSRPTSLSNLIQLSCEGSRKSPNLDMLHSSLAFNNRNDWLAELRRCNADEKHWRVCLLISETVPQKALVPSSECFNVEGKRVRFHFMAVLEDYRMFGSESRSIKLESTGESSVICSYPFCVVVPSDLFDVTVYDSLIPNWNHGRFPIWCWSAPNGSALMRSSACNKEFNAQDLWRKIFLSVCGAHPRNRQPHTVDCDITASRIASSFEKLRELCSIESTTRFLEKEKEWYSAVDDTGWCALVFRCLQLSRRVIRKLMDNQRSVIVIDDDGYNVSAVIVSLVQICTDRFYRTVAGLNALIEKEWIALGHPFGLNIFNCTYSSHISNSRPQACTATFLLFLDCIAQLVRLHPLAFEYSQYLLIALWDLTVTGLASGLTCNSVSDRLQLGKTAPTFPLSQYFTSKYCLMFTNVLYSANLLLGFEPKPTNLIRPSSCPIDVEFWSECYLRWVRPSSIAEGGALTKDLALSAVLSSAASVAYPDCNSVVWRQRLHPAFDAPNISSSYPYSDALSQTAPLLSEMNPLSETASAKSLRLQFERSSINSSLGAGKLGVERRFSTASLFTRVNELSGEFQRLKTSPKLPRGRPRHHSPPGTLV